MGSDPNTSNGHSHGNGQQEEPKRFSRINLPPSREVALQRADELEGDVAHIEVKLDNVYPDSFESEAEYVDWRRRTISALGYIKQELGFLDRWLARDEQDAAASRVNAIAETICARARQLAREIGSGYEPQFSQNIRPESIDVAHERMGYLTPLKEQIQGALTEVNGSWKESQLTKRDIISMKKPLQVLLAAVDREIAALQSYVQFKYRHLSRNWKGVCVDALTRTVAEGFVLLPDEQQVLEELRHFVAVQQR